MPDRSVLVVTNNADPAGRAVCTAAVVRPLEHLRAPRRTVDTAAGVAEALTTPPAAVILGQPGVGAALSSTDIAALVRAVRSGVGLVNFDGQLATQHPELFQAVGVPTSTTSDTAAAALVTVEPHYLTSQRREERLAFASPVATWPLAPVAGAAVVMEDDSGAPLVIAAQAGQGRMVHFCCAPQLWTFEHLGHGCGLDDVFWRSIVWAARKPFAMLAMPPFVTMRIDDASGSNSAFARAADSAAHRFEYIDELNRHGFIPNVGLFIDDISDDDGALLAAKHAAKEAQFSPHAFRDPKNIAEFPIYLHHDGAEFTPDEMADNFARVDARFAQWGVTPARTLNSHFDEIGENALPFMRERGWMYVMSEVRFGSAFTEAEARAWSPRPFGGFNYVLDEMPGHPEFFTALSQLVPPSGYTPTMDFLDGHTVALGENQANNLAGAIAQGATMVARGLDNLVFGVLMTHEQRIAALSLDQWSAIVHGIAREIGDYEKIFVPYDEVSAYARARHGVDLARVTYLDEPGVLECATSGHADRELMLHVFMEDDGEIVRTFHRLPAGKDVVFQVRV